MEPSFHHYPDRSIPALTVQGVAVRVMMGAAYGIHSPVRTFASTLYVEARLQAGQRLLLPEAAQRAVYVAQGGVRIGDEAVPAHAMAVLGDAGGAVTLHASDDSQVAIIGGENLGPRFMNWNFVSSRKERIAQARDDWANGRFPKVPGDEVEFIPLPA